MNSKDDYHHKIYNRKNEIIKIYYKRTWKMLSLIYIIKHYVTFRTIMWIYVFDMENIHMLLRNIKKLQKTVYGIPAAAANSLHSCPISVWSQRRQPTRLPHPWDSPGKNTGVGCHFFLQWYPYFCKNKCIYLEFNMHDI